MSEQLVPATPVVEQHTQPGSRFVCVGLDALSAADELVEGVSLDLQQVIAKMKQAAHVKYTPGAKFGTENKAVLHTYIQVSYCPMHHTYIQTCTVCMNVLVLLYWAGIETMLHASNYVACIPTGVAQPVSCPQIHI